MLQDADHTIAISHASAAEESPFAYGEGTVMKMQSQQFDVQDELGPMMVKATELVASSSAPPVVISDEDPLVRMEKKLDLALRQIEKLQQRIESLDLTLARTLMR